MQQKNFKIWRPYRPYRDSKENSMGKNSPHYAYYGPKVQF